ncbi:MAG: hypothetical protein AB8I08_14770 [Sandaracinaceae bacterium]
MGFRDDNEALRQQVTVLRAQLADAKDETGPSDERVITASGDQDLELNVELDADGTAHVIEALRRHAGRAGEVQHIGAPVTWKSGLLDVTVAPDPEQGRTTIRLRRRRFRWLAPLLAALIVGWSVTLGKPGPVVIFGPLLTLAAHFWTTRRWRKLVRSVREHALEASEVVPEAIRVRVAEETSDAALDAAAEAERDTLEASVQ